MKNSPIFKLAETTLRCQKRHMQSLVKVSADYVTEQVLRGVDAICKDNSRKKVKDVIYEAINDLAVSYPKAKDEHRDRLVALISELMRVCLQASQSLDMMEAKAYLVQFQNEEFPRVIAEIRSCIYDTLEEDEDSTEFLDWAEECWGQDLREHMPQLPQKLDLKEFKDILSKAIQYKLISYTTDSYKWQESDRLLVYFSHEVSEHLQLSNNGIAWKPFKDMFESTINMSSIWSNMDNTQPEGYEKVNKCLA